MTIGGLKMKHSKLFSFGLPLVILIACAFLLTVSVSAEVSVVVSDGVMTVSGSGEMPDAAAGPEGAEAITSVVIENGVTSVGAYAFAECYNLTSVVIAPSVTSIGAHAFDGCESLVSVRIPDSVLSIGENAFFGCLEMTTVDFGNGLQTIMPYAFAFCSSLTDIVLPDKVQSVGNYAFSYCSMLGTASLPESTQLGTEVFLSCADGFALTLRSGGEEPPASGFVTTDGNLYYYENGEIRTGWFQVEGRTYYASIVSGICFNFDKKIGGKQYFWDDTKGLVLANGFREVPGGTICYENGYQVTGWRHTDGSGPVVSSDGISEQYSTKPNNLYYFLYSTGFMVTDATYTLGGYQRDFNEDHTVKPLNGIQHHLGEMYYYIDGVMQYGWFTIEGNTYYFRGSNGVFGRAAQQWLYIGNKLYYFYASTSQTPYALKTSGTIGGIGYDYAENGQILYTGFINCDYANQKNSNIAQYVYKMNATTRYCVNGVIQTGWQKIDGKWYYFYPIGSPNGSGYMCVTSCTIDGVTYEFTSDGVCTNK